MELLHLELVSMHVPQGNWVGCHCKFVEEERWHRSGGYGRVCDDNERQPKTTRSPRLLAALEDPPRRLQLSS